MKIKRFRTERSVGPRGFSRWVAPRMSKYYLACCDCALVHEMQFKIASEQVLFRARRAGRYTARLRKKSH